MAARIFSDDVSLIWRDRDEAHDAFGYVGPPDFYCTCSVRFPPADLAIVLERMREFNQTTTASLEGKTAVNAVALRHANHVAG